MSEPKTMYEDLIEQNSILLNKFKQLQQKLEKVKEYINPYLNDICINCKCFENENKCFECDYEHHRSELYYGRTKYNLSKDILQIIEGDNNE